MYNLFTRKRLRIAIFPADMSVDGYGLHIIIADAPDSEALGSKHGGVGRAEPFSDLAANWIFEAIGNFLYKNCLLSRSLCCIVACSRFAQLFCCTVLWLAESWAGQIIVVFENISGIQCV